MMTLPQNDVFEISLIGTGGGYGESVVIHLGNQNWIVIDSCIDPYSKVSLPLRYLKDKGVELGTDVKLIICTHWHDDHILGISDLLKSCENAIFCMARTTDTKKFLQFVGLDYHKLKSEASASSTIEIMKCFEICKNRNRPIKGAEQDRLLWSNANSSINSKIYSLSPSDFVVNEFGLEISTLISDFGISNRKVVFQSPNDKSVALLVSVNDYCVLLGSDLEVSNSNQKGWLCILDTCQCVRVSEKASLFKLPHHGSINGYHVRIWEELLKPDVIAKLAPFNSGRKLPQNDMLEKYLGHTNKLFITSFSTSSNSAKKRERSIAKAISKFNSSLFEIKYKFGIVRSRINVFDSDEIWETNLFGEAVKISKDILIK